MARRAQRCEEAVAEIGRLGSQALALPGELDMKDRSK